MKSTGKEQVTFKKAQKTVALKSSFQTTLPGFKADTQFESKYDYGVTHTVSIDLEKRGSQFMARIIIHEKSSDAPSHGGSSFRTDVKGHRYRYQWWDLHQLLIFYVARFSKTKLS